MGLFSTSADERVRRTRVATTYMRRDIEETDKLLRKMEYLLERLQREVPKSADGAAIRGLEQTMELSARHAARMKQHMLVVEHHITRVETAAKKR